MFLKPLHFIVAPLSGSSKLQLLWQLWCFCILHGCIGSFLGHIALCVLVPNLIRSFRRCPSLSGCCVSYVSILAGKNNLFGSVSASVIVMVVVAGVLETSCLLVWSSEILLDYWWRYPVVYQVIRPWILISFNNCCYIHRSLICH